jgi:hypothetical protein
MMRQNDLQYHYTYLNFSIYSYEMLQAVDLQMASHCYLLNGLCDSLPSSHSLRLHCFIIITSLHLDTTVPTGI